MAANTQLHSETMPSGSCPAKMLPGSSISPQITTIITTLKHSIKHLIYRVS
ncbi:hypothetical protein Hanom_Chr13g01198511 [Helianthus anomalus]